MAVERELQLCWHMLDRDLSLGQRQIARFMMDLRMGFLQSVGAYDPSTRIMVKLQDTTFPQVLRYADRTAGIAASQSQMLTVAQQVAAVGRSSFQLRYRLALRGSEQALAQSTCVLVCVGVATGKPARLPEAVRAQLAAASGGGAEGGSKFALKMAPHHPASEAFSLPVVPMETDEDHNEHVNQSNFIKVRAAPAQVPSSPPTSACATAVLRAREAQPRAPPQRAGSAPAAGWARRMAVHGRVRVRVPRGRRVRGAGSACGLARRRGR